MTSDSQFLFMDMGSDVSLSLLDGARFYYQRRFIDDTSQGGSNDFTETFSPGHIYRQLIWI